MTTSVADDRPGEPREPAASRGKPADTRALEALRESEEQYRALVENANDIVYTHDLAGRFTSINRAAESLTGYSADEALQMTIDEIVEPKDRPLVRDMLARKLQGEPRSTYELSIRARDGRPITLEVSTRIIEHHGTPIGVHGIGRDITERKRGGELLRESEERFRLLVENSTDGIYLVGHDGLVVYASPAVTRMLGFGIEKLVGRHFLDFLHPDDRDEASWFFADVLGKPGAVVRARYRCLHQDGEFRHLEGVGVNRLKEPGVGAVVLNFRDVTDRHRAERSLAESEERFRAVFESALVGIARAEPGGRLIEANRALQEMLGLSAEELRGRPIRELFHPEEAEAAQRDWKDLADGAIDHYRAERRVHRRDGQSVWVNFTASMVHESGSRPRFGIVMLENISERKQAEAALQETNRRLADWVAELEQRKSEISLLSEMGDMLRACRSPEEAYEVIAPLASQLFPGESGTVSVIAPGAGLAETVAEWGSPSGARLFSMDECWALRRGRPHLVEHGQRGLVCKHAGEPRDAATVCVPMLAQGELLGLLHMTLGEERRALEPRIRFVTTVAEHIALAIANLKLRETLRSQSIRDPLTGLFNRRYMEESLEREMRRAARGRTTVAIIMLDLDFFKGFNDTYGHEAGDALLRIVGQTLQKGVRAEDIACRYGGEEFTLIVPEVSLEEAFARAEEIRLTIRALTIEHRRQQVGSVTISAGVAMYPDHGPTGDAVRRAADSALYRAKALGRDRIVVNRGLAVD